MDLKVIESEISRLTKSIESVQKKIKLLEELKGLYAPDDVNETEPDVEVDNDEDETDVESDEPVNYDTDEPPSNYIEIDGETQQYCISDKRKYTDINGNIIKRNIAIRNDTGTVNRKGTAELIIDIVSEYGGPIPIDTVKDILGISRVQLQNIKYDTLKDIVHYDAFLRTYEFTK